MIYIKEGHGFSAKMEQINKNMGANFAGEVLTSKEFLFILVWGFVSALKVLNFLKIKYVQFNTHTRIQIHQIKTINQ